jgi:hypothetical protein
VQRNLVVGGRRRAPDVRLACKPTLVLQPRLTDVGVRERMLNLGGSRVFEDIDHRRLLHAELHVARGYSARRSRRGRSIEGQTVKEVGHGAMCRLDVEGGDRPGIGEMAIIVHKYLQLEYDGGQKPGAVIGESGFDRLAITSGVIQVSEHLDDIVICVYERCLRTGKSQSLREMKEVEEASAPRRHRP